MKKWLFALIIFSIFFVFTVSAMAADIMISGKLTSVSQKISKNGNPYVLLILPEQKELNGIKYESETNVFCFNPTPEAKALKSGDSIKLIARRTNNNGSEFTTLVKLVK